MAATAINPLRFARRLKDAGVPAAQAEAMADALGEELVEQLMPKSDFEHALAARTGKGKSEFVREAIRRHSAPVRRKCIPTDIASTICPTLPLAGATWTHAMS